VVYKVRLTPHHTARKQFYNYHRANWAQFQHILAAILHNPPRTKGERDFDRALHTVTATILMAAEQTIPKRTTHRRSPSIPRHIQTLLRIRNYIRWQYQRTRQAWLGYILQLLNNLTTTSLCAYHNLKWATFLRTLHPRHTPLWREVRHFKNRRVEIPPLTHQGTLIYSAALKADLLASQFEENHKLTTPQVGSSHANAVDRMVDRFWKRRTCEEGGIPRVHTSAVQRLYTNFGHVLPRESMGLRTTFCGTFPHRRLSI
jgi:hypothetical protein